jgi:hypothetical protein
MVPKFGVPLELLEELLVEGLFEELELELDPDPELEELELPVPGLLISTVIGFEPLPPELLTVMFNS